VEKIGSIHIPDVAKPRAIRGIVVAVGPGKWHPGEWWYFQSRKRWEWLDGWCEGPWVKVGQQVYFNSQWNDLAGDHQQESLPAGAAPELHIVQFQDIFGIIPD
jgi:co-chaperonin GroES (HSP10)